MNFNYIINPETGRKVSIHGKTGKKVLKTYSQLAGSSKCTEFHGQPINCNAHSEDDINCVYTAGKVKGEVGQCKKSSSRDIEKSRKSARTRDSLVRQFENDAGNRLLKSWKSKKFNRTVKSAMTNEEKRMIEEEEKNNELLKEEALKKIKNCANCAMSISNYSQWNDNDCDTCETENELFGDDAMYFRLRKSELKNFSEKIYPMLYEMAGSDGDMLNRFINDNYVNDVYGQENFDDFKASFIKDGNKSFMKFYKKVSDLHKIYSKKVANIKDLQEFINVEVFVNLDDESMYYHNFDSGLSTYDINDIVSNYCSSAKNAGECCRIDKCRWNGEITRCNNKKGCKNVYADSIVNKGCNTSDKVKRNKTYRSSTKGTCIF